jgi:xylulokinase
MARLALGLDSSTQSLSAVAVDLDSREIVYQKSLDYLVETELSRFGINSNYILPPQEKGEAKQPVVMFFSSLDVIFRNLSRDFPGLGLDVKDIRVINTSGQQHGHVLLNRVAESFFANLHDPSAGEELVSLLEPGLAVPFARIWRTANTVEEATLVRQAVGGKEAIIELTGSNAPLRFSAFGIRKTALAHPAAYEDTEIIHQISSLVPAVLIGSEKIPLDYGNACGTSLMNYRARNWSKELIEAVSGSLPGGAEALGAKLPALASGLTVVGKLAPYFTVRYGLSSDCAVAAGSGDNPQTKVLVEGSLLSLGTSFVIMVETDGKTFDRRGYANAMYDALDRPFCFGCRTNGALRWDGVRAKYGLAKKDYAPGEKALAETSPGNQGRIFLWQAEAESFPVSKAFEPVRIGYEGKDFAEDYAGIIESTLASVYLNSRHFMAPGDLLYVTGGPAGSPEILRRVAAIWNRTVVPVEAGGAALGAAVSGGCTWLIEPGEELDPGNYCASFLRQKKPVNPRREDVAAYHGEGGYLERFREIEERLLTGEFK